MRNTLHRVVLSVIVAFSFPAAALGTITYSNTTTDTLQDISYAANGFTRIGDEITLAGTDRLATSAVVQFFSDGSAGTFDATLELFNVGSPVGAQIGSGATVTGISVAGDPNGDEVNVTFTLPNLLVPDSLIFAVSIANLSSGAAIDGLELDDPVTIGSSDPTFAVANSGSGLTTVGTLDNVFFELNATSSSAVPEPATAGLAGSALLALALRRRRPARRG
jgi:hypothetical protein